MKTKIKKISVEEFADIFKNNPEKIIAWCKKEIEEFQKLIKIILENKSVKTNRSK